MALLDQYAVASAGDDFTHRTNTALWGKARVELGLLVFTSPTPTDNEKREARTIRDILRASPDGVAPVVRLLASADLSSLSTDLEVQTAVDNNWDKIVLLFDPTLDG